MVCVCVYVWVHMRYWYCDFLSGYGHQNLIPLFPTGQHLNERDSGKGKGDMESSKKVASRSDGHVPHEIRFCQ